MIIDINTSKNIFECLSDFIFRNVYCCWTCEFIWWSKSI